MKYCRNNKSFSLFAPARFVYEAEKHEKSPVARAEEYHAEIVESDGDRSQISFTLGDLKDLEEKWKKSCDNIRDEDKRKEALQKIEERLKGMEYYLLNVSKAQDLIKDARAKEAIQDFEYSQYIPHGEFPNSADEVVSQFLEQITFRDFQGLDAKLPAHETRQKLYGLLLGAYVTDAPRFKQLTEEVVNIYNSEGNFGPEDFEKLNSTQNIIEITQEVSDLFEKANGKDLLGYEDGMYFATLWKDAEKRFILSVPDAYKQVGQQYFDAYIAYLREFAAENQDKLLPLKRVGTPEAIRASTDSAAFKTYMADYAAQRAIIHKVATPEQFYESLKKAYDYQKTLKPKNGAAFRRGDDPALQNVSAEIGSNPEQEALKERYKNEVLPLYQAFSGWTSGMFWNYGGYPAYYALDLASASNVHDTVKKIEDGLKNNTLTESELDRRKGILTLRIYDFLENVKRKMKVLGAEADEVDVIQTDVVNEDTYKKFTELYLKLRNAGKVTSAAGSGTAQTPQGGAQGTPAKPGDKPSDDDEKSDGDADADSDGKKDSEKSEKEKTEDEKIAKAEQANELKQKFLENPSAHITVHENGEVEFIDADGMTAADAEKYGKLHHAFPPEKGKELLVLPQGDWTRAVMTKFDDTQNCYVKHVDGKDIPAKVFTGSRGYQFKDSPDNEIQNIQTKYIIEKMPTNVADAKLYIENLYNKMPETSMNKPMIEHVLSVHLDKFDRMLKKENVKNFTLDFSDGKILNWTNPHEKRSGFSLGEYSEAMATFETAPEISSDATSSDAATESTDTTAGTSAPGESPEAMKQRFQELFTSSLDKFAALAEESANAADEEIMHQKYLAAREVLNDFKKATYEGMQRFSSTDDVFADKKGHQIHLKLDNPRGGYSLKSWAFYADKEDVGKKMIERAQEYLDKQADSVDLSLDDIFGSFQKKYAPRMEHFKNRLKNRSAKEIEEMEVNFVDAFFIQQNVNSAMEGLFQPISSSLREFYSSQQDVLSKWKENGKIQDATASPEDLVLLDEYIGALEKFRNSKTDSDVQNKIAKYIEESKKFREEVKSKLS